MSELPEEFFRRDLTEPEEERLGQWLSSSEEGPQRLIALAEAHYRKLGVPEPEWAEGPLPAFFPRARHPFRWLLLSLLALAFSGYFARRWSVRTDLSYAPTAAKAPGARSVRGRASTNLSRNLPAQRKSHPAALRTANRTPGPAASFREELSVEVDHPQAGLVTVKVLDRKGRRVRFLYAGILPAGRRIFTWDGKGEKGAVVPSGLYYLEVTSGSHVLRREVRLDSRP